MTDHIDVQIPVETLVAASVDYAGGVFYVHQVGINGTDVIWQLPEATMSHYRTIIDNAIVQAHEE